LELKWSELKQPTALIAVVILFLTIIGLGAWTYYTLEYRLPAIEQAQKDLKDDMRNGATDMKSALKDFTAEMRDQVKALNVSIVGLRSTVSKLCDGRRLKNGGCSPQEIYAQVKHASAVQAQLVNSAEVTLNAGATPEVESPVVLHALPQVTWGLAGVTTRYDSKFADVILWTNAAESSHWTEKGHTITANFTNGYAKFEVPDTVAKEHIKVLVDSLNASAQAMQVADHKDPQ